MDKLLFEFAVIAAADKKSNIYAITSISTTDGKHYILPDELQPANLHTAIAATTAFEKVKASIKRRNQSRKVWIELTGGIKKLYVDDIGNIQFQNQFLEEITENTNQAHARSLDDKLLEILEKISEKDSKPKHQSIKKIAEKFIIEKFSGDKSNAVQWINIFEGECNRWDVSVDVEKIELFRLFLEKSCLDWYSSMLIKLTLESDWKTWKDNFCGTYGSKGWSPIRYALTYRYKIGSLLEYAVKKERLLLEVRKETNTGTMIDIIATGLPNFIMDKIDRDNLKNTEDLFNELGKLEHSVKKKQPINEIQ